MHLEEAARPEPELPSVYPEVVLGVAPEPDSGVPAAARDALRREQHIDD